MKRWEKAIIGFVAVVAVLIIVPVMSGCAAPTPTPSSGIEPIKVGIPASVTGTRAGDAEEVRRGVILALEQINASGGLLGRPLKYYFEDTGEESPEEHVVARDRLLANGVDVMIGGDQIETGVVTIYGPYVPYADFNFSIEKVKLFQSNPEEYYMFINGGGTERAYSWAYYRAIQYLIPDTGWEYRNNKMAFQVVQSSVAEGIASIARDYAIEDGWDVVYYEHHNWDTSDFGVQLATLRELDPAVTYLVSWGVAAPATFVNQFHSNPWDTLVHVCFSPCVPEFRSLTGANANGVTWEASCGLMPGDKGEALVQAWTERWGESPGGAMGLWSYDFANRWAAAVRDVGDPKDYRGVIDWMCNNVYEGVTGPHKADPATHVQVQDDFGNTIRPFHVYQIQNEQNVDLFIRDEVQPGVEFITPKWFSSQQ